MKHHWQKIGNTLIGNSYLHHVLFWLVTLIATVYIFKVSSKPARIDVIYALLLNAPIAIGVYFNLGVLIPRLLRKKQTLLYVLCVLALISAESGFYLLFFSGLVDIILPGYYFIAYLGFWDFSLMVFIYFFSSTLLKIAKEWYRSMELANQNKQFELMSLQQQLNPHFLFNTLNTLYGMSLTNHKNTPGAIIKLSGIMRYVLYETQTNKVPLNKEVEHIRDIVELHKLRLGDKKDRIKLDIDAFKPNQVIAPNIIMPLVENALKHSNTTEAEKFYVHFTMYEFHNNLMVRVENNLGQDQKSKQEGIGLQNLNRRLELLYGDDYEFFPEKKIDSFDVRLKLPIWKMDE